MGELACAQTSANVDLRLAQALAGTNAQVLQYWPETLLTQVGLQTIEQWSAAWSRLESEEEEGREERGVGMGDVLGGGRKAQAQASPSSVGQVPQQGERIMCLKQEWFDRVISLEKSIELRSQRTRPGYVWLAVGNTIKGCARIESCEKLSLQRFQQLRPYHCVGGDALPYDKTPTWALYLGHVKPLEPPTTFWRKQGVQGWARVHFQQERLPQEDINEATRAKTAEVDREAESAQNERLLLWTGEPLDSKDGDIGAHWCKPADVALFERTCYFTPMEKTLMVDQNIKLPKDMQQGTGVTFISANTLGDGACGIHAAFGYRNEEGQLEKPGARHFAAQALDAAMSSGTSSRLDAVWAMLWSELALPGALGTAGPEGRLFWQHFSEEHPELATAVLEQLACEKELEAQGRHEKRWLVEHSRQFLLQADKQAVLALCHRLGYATAEGTEDCYEIRGGQKYVKGASNQECPTTCPRTKLEAIQQQDPVFDGLRISMFLERDLLVCIRALKEIQEETGCCGVDNLVMALEVQLQKQHGNVQVLPEPMSFRASAKETYLQVIMNSDYFFSYDEIALVAEMHGQQLLIAQDEGDYFKVCCVAEVGDRLPIVILIKAADGSQRVRSHFERLISKPALDQLMGLGAVKAIDRETRPEHGLSQQASGVPPLIVGDVCPPICEKTGPQAVEADGSDGGIELERAVAALLHAYGSGESVDSVLNRLPMFSTEITDASWAHFQMRLNAAVREYVCCNITAAEAVNLATPLWRTCFFPILVLFETWGRTTGLPTIFYVDSFYTLLASLLKKDITYNAANFACRARYWAVGTAAPGSGKSPALEPLKKALIEVLNEAPELAPGKNADGFHIQPVGTHMAAIDRLRAHWRILHWGRRGRADSLSVLVIVLYVEPGHSH